MMDINMHAVIETLVFSVIGIVVLVGAFLAIDIPNKNMSCGIRSSKNKTSRWRF